MAALTVAVAAGVVGMQACGASNGDPVANVSGIGIASASVARLATTLAREHIAPRRQGETVKQYALSLRITAQWVIAEAQAQGVAVSETEAEHGVSRKIAQFPGGKAEFEGLNSLSGRTLADATLAEREALAASKLVALVASRQAKVTPTEVVAYYRRHKQSFRTDEQRKAMLAHFSSKSLVEAVKRKLVNREPVAFGVLEALEYAQGTHPASENAVYAAVYSATVDVPTGPLKEGQEYFVFELTEVLPAVQEPLASVASKIAESLRNERESRALAMFVRAWRQRWTPKTTCARGWVVEGCREHIGANVAEAEDPFGSDLAAGG